MTVPDPVRLPLWLRVCQDVGADRYLSHAELPPETGTVTGHVTGAATGTVAAAASGSATGAGTTAIWETYDRLFGRFTGSGADPLFDRFAHPADGRVAAPLLPHGLSVVITGTGPSLDAARDDLRRCRDRLLIASSPAGAAALQARGLHADLVLIEHQTVFDAQAAVEDRRHGEAVRLHDATTVIAPPGTAPALLADLGARECRLADTLPTWGLWPATLTALALQAGAPAVGLVGFEAGPTAATGDSESMWAVADDAGTTPAAGAAGSPAAGSPATGAAPRVDWSHHRDRPLIALLELLAQASGVCHDCGPGSVPKHGWPFAPLQAVADMSTGPRQPIGWQNERPATVFLQDARHDLAAVRPLLADAREACAMALQARAGNMPPYRDLTRAIDLMLAWGADPPLRRVLQHGIGLSFLPRFWRSGIRIGSAAQLWRPVALALHELTSQAGRLEAIVEGAYMGTRGARDAGRTDVAGRTPPADPPPVASFVQPPAARTPAPVVLAIAPEPGARGTAPIADARKSRGGDVAMPGRVTVLLPLKNGLPHLEQALASLVAQTHPDVEILVIDDGSDDGGRELVLGRAMSHVRLVPSNGQGIAAALNTGLTMATGLFIARQDADDWSHPERLARQCEYLMRHPEIDVLATCAEFVDAEGRPIETAWTTTVRRQYDGLQTPEALARWLPRVDCLQHGSVMARRETLRRARGYRAAFPCAQEYDLSLRLLPEARFAKLPSRLYTSRVHDRQASQQQQDQQRRAIVRAKLEFVRRQVPRLAASARVAFAGDARSAALLRDVWREIADEARREAVAPVDVLPPSPGAPGAPGADGAAWRELLARVDALLIPDGDRVEDWLAALTAADGGEWHDVGVALVRRRPA